MRLLPLLVLVCLLSLQLAGCGSSEPGDPLARIRARGALVVATEAEMAPFEYIQPDGSIAGFDVDLARAVADDLGVKLELRNVKFVSIWEDLATGRSDLIASAVTITEERRRSVLFSQPYFFTVTALLVNKAKAGEIRSIVDLDREGRVLAVKAGTTGEAAARERCPRARIVSHETENGAALDVAEGRADAFLYDLANVKQHHKNHADRTVLLLEPVTYEPYALAVRPEDAALMARADAVISAMRKDGRLAELMKRHGPDGSLEKP